MISRLRDTRQRRAIRGVLEDARQPMTTVAIHKAAVLSLPKLSAVTIYRVWHAFVTESLINPVAIPGAVSHYELARDHHHHFFCRACSQVLDVPCDGHPTPPCLAPHFRVEEQQAVLVGLCADCATQTL